MFVGDATDVALFVVNRSKSSSLVEIALVLLVALDDHGSLLRLSGLLLLFVLVDVFDEDDHGFIRVLGVAVFKLGNKLPLLACLAAAGGGNETDAHGSTCAGAFDFDNEDNGGKKSSLSVSLTGLVALLFALLDHGSEPNADESPRSTN